MLPGQKVGKVGKAFRSDVQEASKLQIILKKKRHHHLSYLMKL